MKKPLLFLLILLLLFPYLNTSAAEPNINYYQIRYQIACRNYDTTDARCFWNKVEFVHAKEILGRDDIADYLTSAELERVTKKIGFLQSRYKTFCQEAEEPAYFCSALGKLVEKGQYFGMNKQLHASAAEVELFNVVKVVDGDTISVSISGKTETIRLIGLDTPETVDPRKTVECFGKEASDKAKSLLAGKKVKLTADESQGDKDKYNRLLRYVFLEDGTNVNKLMISEGYGHEYTYNLPYKYQAEFKTAELSAQRNKKGLWADNACAVDTEVIELEEEDAGTIDVSDRSCSSNLYNCTGFSTHNEAQAVYDKCMSEVGSDIHQLDADDDGEACESLE